MGYLCLQHAAFAPNKVAIRDRNQEICYGELYENALSIGYALADSILSSKGSRVILFIPKSIKAIETILGILCSGNTYIPVDVNSPEKRFKRILDLSNASAIITTEEYKPRLLNWNLGIAVKSVEELLDYPKLPEDLDNTFSYVDSEENAYILFTSGSTGFPNGVQIPHRAVDAFFRNVHTFMQVDRHSKCLNTSPLHFDVSIVDIFYPLSRGATIYLTPTPPYPAYVLHMIEEKCISHMCGVGSTLNIMVSSPDFKRRNLDSLQRIMTGAEILNPNTLRMLLDQAPNTQIINGYGPTEATCVCIAHSIDASFNPDIPSIPIGRALRDVDIKIMPNGELAIAGPQVMNGYVNNDELTNKRLQYLDNKNYYLTGDIVQLDDNENYHFIGRVDHEIKFRGYRIHPSEILNALKSHPLVLDAVVEILHRDNSSMLVAAVLHTIDIEEESLNSEILKIYLEDRIPRYMIPSSFVFVDTFPKLPSGKLDIKSVSAMLEASYG